MIEVYNLKGHFIRELDITLENLIRATGMKCRCTFNQGDTVIGYFSVHDNQLNGYFDIQQSYDVKNGFGNIYVVHWKKIKKLEVITYSHPRWGTRVDLTFNVDKSIKAEAPGELIIPEFLKHH